MRYRLCHQLRKSCLGSQWSNMPVIQRNVCIVHVYNSNFLYDITLVWRVKIMPNQLLTQSCVRQITPRVQFVSLKHDSVFCYVKHNWHLWRLDDGWQSPIYSWLLILKAMQVFGGVNLRKNIVEGCTSHSAQGVRWWVRLIIQEGVKKEKDIVETKEGGKYSILGQLRIEIIHLTSNRGVWAN